MRSPGKIPGGIYILILKLNSNISLAVGKLGIIHFRAGHYYYIGSALGSGGFKRVTRHFDVASGKNMTRKWHIDHLLPHSEVICALMLPACEPLECEAAGIFMDFSVPIPDFGCSDCKCHTHLFFTEKDLMNEIINEANKLIGKTGKDRISDRAVLIYHGMSR